MNTTQVETVFRGDRNVGVTMEVMVEAYVSFLYLDLISGYIVFLSYKARAKKNECQTFFLSTQIWQNGALPQIAWPWEKLVCIPCDLHLRSSRTPAETNIPISRAHRAKRPIL